MIIGLRSSTSFTLLATLASFAAGCGPDKEPEMQYQPGINYGTGGAGAYPAQGGAPTGYGAQAGQPGVVPTTTPTTAPTTAPTAPTAPTNPMATPIDPGAAAVVQPVINELAKTHMVAGSKAVGSVLVGNFQTGQKLEASIQLQPNKCYTVVATSLPPVSELNVQLVAATPLPNLTPVLAADSETGPTAVIGKKPNCYKWAFPVAAPAKLVVEVTAGSGLAAAQLYEK